MHTARKLDESTTLRIGVTSENHHRLPRRQTQFGGLFCGGHPGEEGLGDMVRLQALHREDGEATATPSRSRGRTRMDSALDVLRQVVAGEGVRGDAILLDQPSTLVDLLTGRD